MRVHSVLALLVLLSASPALAGSAPDPARMRDQTSRLAVAVLGEICLLNLGDPVGITAATAPGSQYGFIDAPNDIATPLLNGRKGTVRVLRRAGLGAITLVAPQDGDCAVMAEYADSGSIRAYLLAMIERGGLKDGGTLMPVDSRDSDGVRLTDYAFTPAGWFAKMLARRFGGDGGVPLPLVTAVSPPGRSATEAVLSVRRPLNR